MIKKLLLTFIAIALGASFFASSTFAQTSILPGGEDNVATYLTESQCGGAVDAWVREYEKLGGSGLPETLTVEGYNMTAEDMLACAVKSGKIKLWMIPYFVRNVLQFLLSIAGLISVLMVIIGAYYYIAGGISDDKEKGKTIIKYALGGVVLSTLAWFIVNIILLIVTS